MRFSAQIIFSLERHGELGFEEVNVMIIEDVWFELKDGRKAFG